MIRVWLVSPKATVRVVTDDDGIIVESAPLVRVFIGQRIYNLTSWMRKRFGHVTAECTFEKETQHEAPGIGSAGDQQKRSAGLAQPEG